MGLKLPQKIIRILLVAMILLSLVLSRLIWIQSSRDSMGDFKNNAAPSAQKLSLKEVFIPIRAIRHTSDQGLQAMTSETILQKLVEEVSQLSFEPILAKEVTNFDEYLNFLEQTGTVELVFGDQIQLNYFFEIFDFVLPNQPEDHVMFNRMVVDFKNHLLSFFDDTGLSIQTVAYQGNLDEFRALLNDEHNQFQEMKQMDSRRQFIHYDYVQDVHLKKYSYILETQAYSVFTNILLDPEQEITAPDDYSKNLKFTTNTGQILSVTNENGLVTFEEPVPKSVGNNIYRLGSYYLDKIGKTVGSVHFFNHTDEHITYRQFVEGYPIFSEDHRASIVIDKKENRLQLALNQNTIHVPIPLDEEVVLPKTETILAQMKQAGVDRDKLSGVQVAYTWANETAENKAIVTLTPEWYVKYADNWQPLNTVLKAVQQEEGSGN